MTVKEWIRESITKNGYAETCKSYSNFVIETGFALSTDSYSRACRKVRQKMEGSDRPVQPFDVTTPVDSTDFHNVDLGKYEVTGVRVNTWGSDNNQNKQVRLDLKTRSNSVDFAAMIEDFKREVAEHVPVTPNPAMCHSTNKLLEISIPDIHLGLLSWHRETGMDYDLKIARETYLEAVSAMVRWGVQHGIEKILLVIGHDLLNSDTPENTTAKGTRQDEDSRHVKSFEFAWQTIRDAIEICLAVADTQVIVVRGNHDSSRSIMVGEVIKAWFRTNTHFEIDNEPKDYKAMQWGKCLIGHAHGHLTKHDKLPGIFANDFPEMWGSTKHRTVHVGHGHTERVVEFPGMTVEMIPSLGAPSAWTVSSGYRSQRAAFGFIWDKELGNTHVYKHRR
jgi:predicted phosphodiesterase